jgi:xanthine/uracil/vitamin C permease (AzgA family)
MKGTTKRGMFMFKNDSINGFLTGVIFYAILDLLEIDHKMVMPIVFIIIIIILGSWQWKKNNKS